MKKTFAVTVIVTVEARGKKAAETKVKNLIRLVAQAGYTTGLGFVNLINAVVDDCGDNTMEVALDKPTK